jgi:ABC-type transport system substrate-binding protein
MKTLFISLVLLFVFANCSNSSNKQQFEHAGGTLSLALQNDPGTYLARDVTDMYTNSVLSQVMEGLVSFNVNDLKVQPQIASKWHVSGDGLTYTFELRNDVYFHENPVFESLEDRKLTIDDVVFTFEKACQPSKDGEPSAAYLLLFRDQLKGAKAFFSGKAKAISGIDVNDNKITLTLVAPDHNFINKIAQTNAAIISKKVVLAHHENDIVGTGPFMLAQKSSKTTRKVLLVKNPDYYLTDAKGNALPYLDSVVFHIQPDQLAQLSLFEKGQIHSINSLPTSKITKMLEGRIKDFNAVPPLMVLYNNPLLFTNFYFFNMSEPRFQDVRVRQAFNYAVDREKLTQKVLKGQFYEPGLFGIVPPIRNFFKGYNFEAVSKVSYGFNPEKARALLAEAGYPNGEKFGNVNLRFNISDINSQIADEVATQLYQVLGIHVNIDGSSFERKEKDADFAKGDIFRTAWAADYSSPETFLSNFYGKFVPNSLKQPSRWNQSRYVNKVFDYYFEQATKAATQVDRFKWYAKAEMELMKNPPLMVLWYANDFQLSYSKVRNLKNNPMSILDLKTVYIKEWTKEAYLKTIH